MRRRNHYDPNPLEFYSYPMRLSGRRPRPEVIRRNWRYVDRRRWHVVDVPPDMFSQKCHDTSGRNPGHQPSIDPHCIGDHSTE